MTLVPSIIVALGLFFAKALSQAANGVGGGGSKTNHFCLFPAGPRKNISSLFAKGGGGCFL